MSIPAAASRKLFSTPASRINNRARIMPDNSIVIPVRDEAENIAPLLDEIEQAVSGRYSIEAVLVDDGSVDATADALRDAMPPSTEPNHVQPRKKVDAPPTSW